MNRNRRHRRLVAWLGFVVLAVVTSVLLPLRADSRAPAELATSQWQRLTAKMARAAEQVRNRGGRPAATTSDRSTAAAAATSPPAPIMAAIPARSTEIDPPRAADGVPAAPWLRPLGESDSEVLARQATEYDAHRPKSVIELQKFRRTYATQIADARGRVGRAELIDLNPRIGAWYLLQLTWDGEETSTYHLTNSRPEAHRLILDSSFPGGLLLEGERARTECDLWSSDSPSSLAAASRLSTPYVTLCDDEVILRRPTAGRRTSLEWATDFLRDNLWGGEALTVLVRDSLYGDAHLVTSVPVAATVDPPAVPAAVGLPRPARIDAEHADDLLTPVDLDLELESPRAVVRVGAWYPARDNPGVFVSVIESGLVSRAVLESSPRRAGRLDAVEAAALSYLVAFDLSRYEVDYAVGTDHPRVGWSKRVRPEMRDDALPGPDGIGEISPLIAGGIVPYSLVERTVATFAGGFKRSHGAFESGALAWQNSGSHYGFVENGVVLSKLQPGLATIFALDDGEVRMKTWSRDDDALLERIRFARQNGVPIVETDAATGEPVPGALVARWGDGNWSGSENRKLRSVRAGICLQESPAGRFLLYGYFSSATPTAMARIFQSYGCSYAMITDMNALEHTYLAIYRVDTSRTDSSRLVVDHLIDGMEVLDKNVGGQILPRFLGFADNRDFFYVLRRLPVRERSLEVARGDGEAAGKAAAK